MAGDFHVSESRENLKYLIYEPTRLAQRYCHNFEVKPSFKESTNICLKKFFSVQTELDFIIFLKIVAL